LNELKANLNTQKTVVTAESRQQYNVEYLRNYYKENREILLANQRAEYQKNREKILEKRKERYHKVLKIKKLKTALSNATLG
jgi:hypothetical protein